ncbi:inner membrane protein YpjD [Alteromonadaceae bacterium M269]|nr:inner membrane protein YpjD [Alteromonadaceae bacterium M269]
MLSASFLTISLVSLVLYLGSAFLLLRHFFNNLPGRHPYALPLAGAALIAHIVILANSILLEPGQNMSIVNVASLIAWLISVSMTLASLYMTTALLLPVVYGFAGLVILLKIFVPDIYMMQISLNPSLVVHITLALLAYGCLMIALLYALQLGYINSRLKAKQTSLVASPLPPLMAVEAILFKLLSVGTILLALSLMTGFGFMEDMFAQHQVHKTVLSVIAWFIYAGICLGHYKYGWRGKPVVGATVVAASLLTLAYFGSRFVKEVILS